MAKKRTTTAAGIAEAQGGRKKRQAARESEAKISRMVEDERDADDDDFDEVVSTRPDKLQAVATPKLVRPEDMPLYAPGLRLFEGFSDTIRNTEIAALTKVHNITTLQSLRGASLLTVCRWSPTLSRAASMDSR